MDPQFNIGDKVLITTSQWFYAPDGRSYCAVFGTVRGVHDDEKTLDIKTNRNSANWYVEIGNTMVAGCQVHYAVRTNSCNLGDEESWREPKDGEVQAVRYSRPSSIYNADGGEG